MLGVEPHTLDVGFAFSDLLLASSDFPFKLINLHLQAELSGLVRETNDHHNSLFLIDKSRIHILMLKYIPKMVCLSSMVSFPGCQIQTPCHSPSRLDEMQQALLYLRNDAHLHQYQTI